MEINPIKSEQDYRLALNEVDSLMSAEANTPEGDRLDVLATLVEAYERKHYPVDPPTPIEAIRFRMEQQGLRPNDLTPIFGRPNRFYEVMNGTRGLTITMIQRLHSDLGIPYESLLGEPNSRGLDERARSHTIRAT